MIFTKENESFSIREGNISLFCSTVLGSRDDQQDSVGFLLDENQALIVLCDGMGGLNQGKKASTVCVESFLENDFKNRLSQPMKFLRQCTLNANDKVRQLNNNSGSTLVSIMITNNELYWSSVGDSRGYILRHGEYVKFTQDHNYKTVLDNQLSTGNISSDTYQAEIDHAEALISYIGIDDLQLIDFNDTPLNLMDGDVIVLMSDGLYRILQEETIFNTINNFCNPEESVKVLIHEAERNALKTNSKMDNTTVVVLKIGE